MTATPIAKTRLHWLVVLAAVVLLHGCRTLDLHYAAGTHGVPAEETAWIVTPMSTMVLEIDGEKVPGNHHPLSAGAIRNWIAVTPGPHELKLFYSTPSVSSAAASTITVRSIAGRTNYVYGRAGGGIRYHQLLLDRPADEALIGHIEERVMAARLPCPTLPCTD